MRRWPPKYETLSASCVGPKLNNKTGRIAKHYTCAKCKQDFPAKEVQVDHIKPVVDVKQGFVDWNTYIERMFCAKKDLQTMCIECHKKKSAKEREKRKNGSKV